MGAWGRVRAWRLFDPPKAKETLREAPSRTPATLRERLLRKLLSGGVERG